MYIRVLWYTRGYIPDTSGTPKNDLASFEERREDQVVDLKDREAHVVIDFETPP
jgi:hypothetical protein